VRVLVDTHVLLWMLQDPNHIAPEAAEVLKAEDTAIVVSVVSIWEIAIKRAAGKLNVPEDLPDRLRRLGHETLGLNADHAWRAGALPPHHRDPFDRALVAQALVEDLPLITHDQNLFAYEARIIRA
jgi:PIN domain nuclease of toxin-antitoxin system